MQDELKPCPLREAIRQANYEAHVAFETGVKDGAVHWRDGLAQVQVTLRNALTRPTAPVQEDAVERAREALRKSIEGWENVIEFGLLPVQHRAAARILADEAAEALAALQPAAASDMVLVPREPAKAMLGLVAYVTGLDEELRWTPEFTRYVSGRFDQIDAMLSASPSEISHEGN